METLSAAQDDSSGANPSSIKSDDSSPQHDSGSSSPPPNCAICLGTCKNKSFTDSCLHQFCFSCLLTWSKVKAECPLCKQSFRSIIHNVRSNHQYEEYMVEQRQSEESSSRIDINGVVAATRRFRYRTTLTLPRRETMAIQQLLLHYPLVADVFPPPAPRAPPARRRRGPDAFRRTVYRHNLWARLLPDFTGRFRDCSPEFYRYNDTQMHRLVPWLNRELHYLLNENVGHISYVMSRILELLPQHHINSPEFREVMQRYFGDRTEHFLHELYCFASTPYDLAGYDRNVQYTTDSRISTMVNEVISSSDSEESVDSDIVVMVSGSDPPEPPPGPSRLPAPVYPQNYISQPVENNVIPIETISHSDTDDDSSEVMVVGYIKPPQERTPEVVDLLGSDSDVIVQDAPQPEPAQNIEVQENRPTPAVKLTLKRHRARESGESDSDDSTYVPPPHRRRARSQHSASEHAAPECEHPSNRRSESQSCTSTAMFTSPASASTSSVLAFTSSSSTSTDTSSDESIESRHWANKNKSTKRSSKRVSSTKDRKKNKKRSSHSNREKKTIPGSSEKEKRSKRKSHSGKGVKSSKKASESLEPSSPRAPSAADEAGPSGRYSKSSKDRKRRRRDNREIKRLKSVVNIMYNSDRNSGELSTSGCSSNLLNNSKSNNKTDSDVHLGLGDQLVQKTEANGDHVDQPRISLGPSPSSDSEDDLPLNLTLLNYVRNRVGSKSNRNKIEKTVDN